MPRARRPGPPRAPLDDGTALELYHALPPADGRCAWFLAMSSAAGVGRTAVESWHRQRGLPPRVLTSGIRCRACGAVMPDEWAARNAAKRCRPCCRRQGLAAPQPTPVTATVAANEPVSAPAPVRLRSQSLPWRWTRPQGNTGGAPPEVKHGN